MISKLSVTKCQTPKMMRPDGNLFTLASEGTIGQSFEQIMNWKFAWRYPLSTKSKVWNQMHSWVIETY